MKANQLDVCAGLLLECKKVIGSVDFERFDHDSDNRADGCQRVISQADDCLFDIIVLVNREIDNEKPTH